MKNELFFSQVNPNLLTKYKQELQNEIKSQKAGHHNLPDEADFLIDKIRAYKADKSFKNIVLLGIGGSSLGVKALYFFLKNENCEKKLHFLDNTDTDQISTILKLPKKDIVFIIASKSGNTIEVISMLKIIIKAFDLKPEEYKKHFICITQKDSNLEKFAIFHNMDFFNIDKNVSGRFSVFSAMGLLPLELCDIDTKNIIKGAKLCKSKFEDNDIIFQKAYHYIKGEFNANVVFCYLDKFELFNKWYIQLWAESLGKNGFGYSPIGLIGSVDQHSFLQLIMEGKKDKTITFIIVKNIAQNIKIPKIKLDFLEDLSYTENLNLHKLLNSQAKATMKSMINEQISTDLITLEKLDEKNCGFLMYYYELLTSICGIMLKINAYDQPGVEKGKLLLKQMLKNE